MNKKTISGRKPALSVKQQRQIIHLSGEKDFPLKQLAVLYDVSYMTIYRIIKRSATPEQGVGQTANQQQTANHDTRPRIYSAYG